MIELPDAFKERMKELLGTEYEPFLRSYEKERVHGLRINTLKIDLPEFISRNYFNLNKIEWAREGYHYPGEERPGKHPCHEAGLYYIQEPSAMAVVELLEPKPGDFVLDLCAAPGGKSTQIAAKLCGKGFLLSNEIHPGRAKILSQNIERMGIRNAVVSNEAPSKLKDYFPEYFDKIVVDAPCSGEGMFRKDKTARVEWSEDHVRLCSQRQADILEHAYQMLKPGGCMVYSTCTFSPEENEGSVQVFLNRHPDMSVVETAGFDRFDCGKPEWIGDGSKELRKTFRLWPHKVDGEGHYIAVLKKGAGPAKVLKRKYPSYVIDQSSIKVFFDFCNDHLTEQLTWRQYKSYVLFGDQLYLLSEFMPDIKGLKIVRPGLHLGTIKKNRFEPSHALALSLRRCDVRRWYTMDSNGSQVVRYLKGETIMPDSEEGQRLSGEAGGELSGLCKKGWVLMCTDGDSLGWSKMAGGILKNHYPKGLRWM